MEINFNSAAASLKVQENSRAGEIFRNLSPGSSVTAGLKEKISSREAVLRAGGREFRAFFQNGVPAGRFLSLVLDARRNGVLYFSIKKEKPENLIMNIMKGIPLVKNFSSGSAAGGILYLNSLSGSSPSLFELNRILSGAELTGGKGLASVFSGLALENISPSFLHRLAVILAENVMPHGFFHLIQEKTGGRQYDGRKRQREEQGKRIQFIKDDFDNIKAEADRKALLSGILSVFSALKEKVPCFELPFPEGEIFVPVRCLKNENVWFFQAEFSEAGTVESCSRV